MLPQLIERASHTAREMLADRGFTPDDRSGFPVLASKDGCNMRVEYLSKVSAHEIDLILPAMQRYNVHRMILVTDLPMKMDDVRALGEKVENFGVLELTFNVARIPTIGKHVLLSPEEKQAFLAREGITQDKLPKLFAASDRWVRHLGGRRGDIIKVTSQDEQAGWVVEFKEVI